MKILLFSLSALLPLASLSSSPWSVSDSINVRYFATKLGVPNYISPTPEPLAVRFAPDGKHFFFLSWHGDLDRDETVYTLWIHRTGDIRQALKSKVTDIPPYRRLTMRSGFSSQPSAPAILRADWKSNRTIEFLGTEGKKTRRPYRYDVLSGTLIPLTPGSVVMENGAWFTRGQTTVFYVGDSNVPDWRRHPYVIIDNDVMEASLDSAYWGSGAYYVSRLNGAPRELIHARGYIATPRISPSEQWVVAGYKIPGKEQEGFQFYLHNLNHAEKRPIGLRSARSNLFTDPDNQDAFRDALWSHDSRRVLIFNATLPTDHNHPQSAATSYIVDYDLATGHSTVVEEFPSVDDPRTKDRRLVSLTWLEEGRRALATYQNGGAQPVISARIYRYDGHRWTGEASSLTQPSAATPTLHQPNDFKIELREGLNEAPRVIAFVADTELVLTDADPALTQVERANSTAISWKDSAGRAVSSILTSPAQPTTLPARPLVIQINDLTASSQLFRPDGEPGTGFAAQLLAVNGFTVLQLDAATDSMAIKMLTPEEGPAQVRRVDDAVDILRARKTIDEASPVGLIGFSRSGFYAYYIATHPGRTPIVAAHVFDSITHGYGEAVIMAALRGADEIDHSAQMYGNRRQFWWNREGWLDAPAFNLHRLSTPTLFSANGPSPVHNLETIGAFRLARRPFEFHLYLDGAHMLQSPRQRAAAIHASVDWMNFWLQDRDPPARTDDPDRARRWRQIQQEWQKVKSESIADTPHDGKRQ